MNACEGNIFQSKLISALGSLNQRTQASEQLSAILKLGYGELPQPGFGSTIERWRALAAVGQHDLSLAKLYEGHTDALAIIAELGDLEHVDWPGSWGVWASESPGGRTNMKSLSEGSFCISGSKLWCSGALTASQGLLTVWPANSDVPQLVAVRMGQTGISFETCHWKAVGMANSMSVKVMFDNVPCTLVGSPGAYLSRPGFWHGGAGVAACWLGGAIGIANFFYESLQLSSSEYARGSSSIFKMAALGKVSMAISHSTAVLRSAAKWIDTNPSADSSRFALTARLSAEQCAKTVIHEVGQAMGASPFCLDEKFAKATADLPVFIRQSHAEKDFAALGERLMAEPPAYAVL